MCNILGSSKATHYSITSVGKKRSDDKLTSLCDIEKIEIISAMANLWNKIYVSKFQIFYIFSSIVRQGQFSPLVAQQ